MLKLEALWTAGVQVQKTMPKEPLTVEGKARRS